MNPGIASGCDLITREILMQFPHSHPLWTIPILQAKSKFYEKLLIERSRDKIPIPQFEFSQTHSVIGRIRNNREK